MKPHSSLNDITPVEYEVMHQNDSPNNLSALVWSLGDYEFLKFKN
jgi:hypothetical protein